MIQRQPDSICQRCGFQGRLAKAHIVPKAFYPRLGDLRAYSTGTLHDTRRPQGIYDPEILCAPCDHHIGQFDDYAARVLRPWPNRADLFREDDGFIARGDDTRYFAYWIRRPDVSKLQGFAASLLWRAAITSRSEMHIPVDDEPRERTRRVFEMDSKADYFVLALSRLPKVELSEIAARPVAIDNPGTPGYQFTMGGLVLSVITAPDITSGPGALGQWEDWLVKFVPFWGSPVERGMRDIVLQEQARSGLAPNSNKKGTSKSAL
jgi:hypothetical protein